MRAVFPVSCLPSLLVVGGLVLAAPLGAQSVRGRVLRVDGVTPAAGVVITALDDRGQRRASALSASTGEYFLRLPAAGRYALRALRIGFRPTIVTGVDVSTVAIRTMDIVLSEQPVALDEVRVAESGDCNLKGRDADTFMRLWEQARGALSAVQLSEDGNPLDVHVVTVSGHVDAVKYLADPGIGPYTRGLNTEIDTINAREIVSDHAFARTRAETLSTAGYVRQKREGGFVFDAPSAEILVSDEFAAQHCFAIAAPPQEHPTWVGIDFTPRISHDSVVDIRGTLWLERSNAELRRLEFEYTNLPPGEFNTCDMKPDPRWKGWGEEPQCQTFRQTARLGLGGESDFVRLPNGAWITARWTIRTPPDAHRWRFSGIKSRHMGGSDSEKCFSGPGCRELWVAWPRLVTTTGTVARLHVAGTDAYQDDSALTLIRAAASMRSGAHPGHLTGIIRNTGGTPLANAIVQVEDPGRAGTTDSTGAFAIQTLPAGRIVVAVRCRGYQPVRFPMTLLADSTRTVQIALVTTAADRAPTSCSMAQ